MNIKLKNIGLVADCEIALNGLTVITGKNNSGKSTVGKALYSVSDAVCDIEQKAENDKNQFIKKQLQQVEGLFNTLYTLRAYEFDYDEDMISSYPSIKSLVTREYQYEVSPKNYVNYVKALLDELKSFYSAHIGSYQVVSEHVHEYTYKEEGKPDSTAMLNERMLNEHKNKAVHIFEKLLEDIGKDTQLVDYARKSINRSLQMELSKQIQPVGFHESESMIELSENGNVYMKIRNVNNEVINDGKPVYFTSPCKKVYFIDNPFVLDDAVSRYMSADKIIKTDTLFELNSIYSHVEKLRAVLTSSKRPSIFEQAVLDGSLKEIKGLIDDIVPGTFEFSTSGDFYIQDGTKLKISDLAAGSKIFAIIKILVEKGELDDTAMLILNEPEAHLHPKWQNALAEIIVLLVKKLGTDILLTTHSSQFILALDAYMRKYDIADITDFYQTVFLDNGLVDYKCVNDDIDEIYQDFLQYLSDMKMLRRKYLYESDEL